MHHLGPCVSNSYYTAPSLLHMRPDPLPSSKFVRSQVIFANTMFRAVCYRPDECQIITGGTDRKVHSLLQ